LALHRFSRNPALTRASVGLKLGESARGESMSTYSYSSGWCERCGRRRGSDGRCQNCDPWFTSPLIQVGVPVLAATAAALVLLVSVFGPKPSLTPASGVRTASRVGNPPLLQAPSSPAWNGLMPSAPNRSGVASAPYFPPVSAPSTVAWTSAPLPSLTNSATPDQQQWSDLESLRSLVWSAAAAERVSESSSALSQHSIDAPTTVATPE
jgi:hypothetical protein